MNLPKDYLEESKYRATRQRFSLFVRKIFSHQLMDFDFTDAKAIGVSRASYYRYWQYAKNCDGIEMGNGYVLYAIIDDGKKGFSVR